MPPLISIIIPCYKQAHYLGECLSSVVAQTVDNWEAIVVDDASPDGAEIERIVLDFSDPRIRLIHHEQNKGLAAARNTGIRIADSDSLAMLDSDDQLLPQFCELAVRCLAECSDANVVYGGFELFGDWGSKVLLQMCPHDKLHLQARFWLPGPGFVMRRSVWEIIGGYCEDEILRLGREEREFWIASIPRITGMTQFPVATYRYRSNPNGITMKVGAYEYKLYSHIAAKHQTVLKRAEVYDLFLAEGYRRSSIYYLYNGQRAHALMFALRGLSHELRNKKLLRLVLLSLSPSWLIRFLMTHISTGNTESRTVK